MKISMTLPYWIVLQPTGKPRRAFKRFRVIAGPTRCRVEGHIFKRAE